MKHSSKTMGKSGKGIQVQDGREQKDEMNMEAKNIGTSSPTKLGPIPPPRTGTSKLAMVWIEHASKQNVTACLTAKEGKMLRDAAQKIEYGNLNSIIPVVIADWKAFTDFCRNDGVGFTLPKTPQIPFFVKFVGKAFEFTKRRQRKLELQQQIDEMKVSLNRLEAQRDEIVAKAFACKDEALPMARKCEIMEMESHHVERWEKVFGPVTNDYLHPKFNPPGDYAFFREEYKSMKLPSPQSERANKYREYMQSLRAARIGHLLHLTPAYSSVDKEIEKLDAALRLALKEHERL